MSMCVCRDCAAYIDSDDDPECFVEVGNMRRLHQTIILCEKCRCGREDEREWMESQASKCEAATEQAEKENTK